MYLLLIFRNLEQLCHQQTFKTCTLMKEFEKDKKKIQDKGIYTLED